MEKSMGQNGSRFIFTPALQSVVAYLTDATSPQIRGLSAIEEFNEEGFKEEKFETLPTGTVKDGHDTIFMIIRNALAEEGHEVNDRVYDVIAEAFGFDKLKDRASIIEYAREIGKPGTNFYIGAYATGMRIGNLIRKRTSQLQGQTQPNKGFADQLGV
jgi:hypothetical protein